MALTRSARRIVCRLTSAATRSGTAAVLAIVATLLPGPASAAPVLTNAAVDATFTRPEVCAVALRLTVSGASSVEHRLELRDGTAVELLGVDGATVSGPPHEVGRTRVLTLATTAAPYTISYRVTQAATWAQRCPLWLPTVPADGRSRNVHLTVTVPEGATASGTMPGFAWTGTRGTATLPHLPAVVIVPSAMAGEARPWDISHTMDITALATLAGSTVWWLRRRRTGAR